MHSAAISKRDIVIVIPAHLNSMRLPSKALLPINGVPMAVHVYRRVSEVSKGVYIATDHQSIYEAATANFCNVVMTGQHGCGTNRVAEAAIRLGLEDDDIVINVQGDEAQIDQTMLVAFKSIVADLLSSADVCTVAVPSADQTLINNANVVKAVVVNQQALPGQGTPTLYFSRRPVPFGADQYHLHVGVYAYRAGVLKLIAGLAAGNGPSRCEKLEQLRWLEVGLKVSAMIWDKYHRSIDTLADYEALLWQTVSQQNIETSTLV